MKAERYAERHPSGDDVPSSGNTLRRALRRLRAGIGRRE